MDGPAPAPSSVFTPATPRWRARPALSLAIRCAVVLLPAVVAAATVATLAERVSSPNGGARILWFGWLFAVGTAVALVLERVARRALPLAILLQLSLVFPDRAPSRFAMARTAGNVRRLEERIAEAKERGVDDEPARAARQILELVSALSAHDRKTRGHSERVRAYTDMLAAELDLGEADRDRLRWAALLHDIGSSTSPDGSSTRPVSPTHTNGNASPPIPPRVPPSLRRSSRGSAGGRRRSSSTTSGGTVEVIPRAWRGSRSLSVPASSPSPIRSRS